jgi:hypothetical protein
MFNAVLIAVVGILALSFGNQASVLYEGWLYVLSIFNCAIGGILVGVALQMAERSGVNAHQTKLP